MLDASWLDGVDTLGVTAGASAPEILVQELVDALRVRYDVTVEERHIIDENVTFSLPRALTA